MQLKVPKSIPDTQVSQKFIQGMIDRMAFGFHNYGPIVVNFPNNYNAMKSMRQRIQKYRKTHNTEWLIDAANYLMIEFMLPKDKKAFFESTSKRESPGAILNDGRISKGKEDFDPKKDRIIVRKTTRNNRTST